MNRGQKIFCFNFIIGVIFYSNGFACQCSGGTYKFVDGLNQYSFIGMVEVVGFDNLKDHDYDWSFTIVKVLQEYHGNKSNDTLYIPSGDGGSCHVSIKDRGLGNRFILKGDLQNRLEWEINWKDFENPPNIIQNDMSVLVLSLCDENTLCIKDEKVVGNITHNNELKRKGKFAGLPQEMESNKVERIIKRLI
jgi:hypothetical protein